MAGSPFVGQPNVFRTVFPGTPGRVGGPLLPGHPECHGSVLAAGSATVFVNGKQAGRIGDPVACGCRWPREPRRVLRTVISRERREAR